jgi:hypothetical protein
MAAPNVFLGGGTHSAGAPGIPTANGAECTPGEVWIDPHFITFDGRMHIRGGDVSIYGGDDWVLDMRNLDGGTISATGNVTLAVGPRGVIDLTGNSERIVYADGQVAIYADTILLDPGVPLFALFGPDVITGPSRILRNVSVVAPDLVNVQPSHTVAIDFWVINASAMTDTFTLSVTNSAGWDISGVPSEITIEELGNQQLTLDLTVPPEAIGGEASKIVIEATSRSDPSASAETHVIAFVPVESSPEAFRVYLPLIWN